MQPLDQAILAEGAAAPAGILLAPGDILMETTPRAISGRVTAAFDLTVSGERIRAYAIGGHVADEMTAIDESLQDGSLTEAMLVGQPVPSEDGRRTFVIHRALDEARPLPAPVEATERDALDYAA